MTHDSTEPDGFRAFAASRVVLRGDKVALLPDPLGGRFTVLMTPEQAQDLAVHLWKLARAAAGARRAMYPALYADDPDVPIVVLPEAGR